MRTLFNKFSRKLTSQFERGGSQAMLYALGLDKNDMMKPQIGIGSVWYEGNPCNSKLNELSQVCKGSILDKDMVGFQFNTVGVSDGMTMGTTGMNYSLPSRGLIADSVETMVYAHHYDGFVGIPGCDKNLPGMAMAMFRLDRPSMLIYGGSMRPNFIDNGGEQLQKIDIVSSFESYGEYLKGDITKEQRENIIQNACNKQCGSCAGLYTANTMASILEVMGLMLPNSSSNLSLSREKFRECEVSGEIMTHLIIEDIKPSDIITKESFYNGIKMLYILGGSSNAIIHLLAMAKEANIDLTLDDFSKFEDTPVLANMKPHGEFVMSDLYLRGGMSSVTKHLIDIGIINGGCMSVTGRTLSENIELFNPREDSHHIYLKDGVSLFMRSLIDNGVINGNIMTPTGKTLNENIMEGDYKKDDIKAIIMDIDKPFKKDSHLKILKGNLAPMGCISKINSDNKSFSGSLICFNTEYDMLEALGNNIITSEHIVLIRYQGETIGCPEMLEPTSALVGYFGDNPPPLITDGRFSGGSKGILVANLPDAYKEGSILPYLKNGDKIDLDLVKKQINIDIDEYDMVMRTMYMNISHPPMPFNKGYVYKYGKYASGIEDGYS
tara:strand:+ start:101 stop:1927 length:1827 start_codon:yes stop_codon:yes gene_type:complete